MEVVYIGFTSSNRLGTFKPESIEISYKPTTVEDHIVIEYLNEHPEVVVKAPYTKKRRIR